MSGIYNALLKRTSTYAVVIMGSVFFFERIFEVGSQTVFDTYNKGKLWKDIKHKYE